MERFEARALGRAQALRGLDEDDAARLEEAGRAGRDAQDVGHQGAPSGPELDEVDAGRAAVRDPALDEEGAEQLAEHLADLRCRHEVAGRAERLAPRVVPVRIGEARRHVLRHGDRSGERDAAAQALLDRRHARAGAAAYAGRASAQATTAPPMSTIGADRTIPMVTGPNRKPSWGSGMRNTSPTMRAAP